MSKSTKPAFITMSFDDWEKAFKPVKNTITPDAPFDGCMFETFDGDLAEVVKWADGSMGTSYRRKVWTIVEGDEGQYVVDGYHRVNRVGYLLTSVASVAGTQYEVNVD